MALQDLTPQLRTRLSRMERAVGWFVLLATALLVLGFAYYLRSTAKRKGWFVPKASYYTFTDRATGLKVGDPVLLMGFEVGEITRIDTMDPWAAYNVYVEFQIKEPYNGYLWTGHDGSRAKVITADLLGKRVLEVTKGSDGYPAYRFHPMHEVTCAEAESSPEARHWLLAAEFYDATGTNLALRALAPVNKENLAKITQLGFKKISVLNTNETRKSPTVVWIDQDGQYTNYFAKPHPAANLYWLPSDETPAITERLEKLVAQVETALPGILSLTNQIATVLSNSVALASNLNVVALNAQPASSNLTALSRQLREPGSLGEWMLGIAGQRQLQAAVDNANSAITNADTNLTTIVENLARSLDNLAGITSNLNAQVQANTNILGSISTAVADADNLVQGLKRHWLLRSAFKSKTTNTPAPPLQRLKSPRNSSQP
jgi:ABC-type transporter Mla subunit MlaD